MNVPKSHPQITREEAVRLAKLKNVSVPFIMGVRGYYLDSLGKPGANDRGIYDDAILIVTHAGIFTYNANTDPSVFRKGIAVLKPGVWLYKKGKHKINSPLGYPALTQYSKVTVVRDGKGDDTGFFGINIHKGGINGTSSLGCQTIYPTQWPDFKARAYETIGSNASIPYVLITEEFRRSNTG